jgi:predicted DNA-binding transcriptional regulator AlpA
MTIGDTEDSLVKEVLLNTTCPAPEVILQPEPGPTTEPPRAAQGLKLSARQIAHRFGISIRTLERWLLNPELRFPRPIRILRRRYWELAEVQMWERRQAATSASKPRFVMNSA